MPSDHPAKYLPAAVVKYCGATNRFGSRWRAVVDRGGVCKWRAAVPFEAGPDAAVEAVLAKVSRDLDVRWQVVGPALTLDGGSTYAYPVCSPELSGL